MSDSRLAADIEISRSSLRSAWIAHSAVLFGLVALNLALNWTIVQAAFRVWEVSPTYSHCFFILPISIFLIWLRRKQVSQVTPKAEPLALLLALPVIAMNLLATIASITEAQQLALIAMVQILTFGVLGRRAYREIAFPMLYLFFLVPMGEYLVGPMQDFTAWFISAGLSALGILHHTEGTVIELVGGSFRVAEACAGLRFLIATIAIGALFCYLNFRQWYKIVIFMSACAIVPVLANGLRALGIVLLAHFSDNRLATGADHLVYGWGFSVFILAILMFTGARFSDQEPRSVEPPPATRAQTDETAGLLWLAVLGCLTIAAVPAFRFWDEKRQVAFDASALSNPWAAAGWQITGPSSVWSPAYQAADYKLEYALHRLGQAATPVDVHLLYYRKSQNGHGLISSSNALWDEAQWHLLSQEPRRILLGGRAAPVQEVIISGPNGTQMIWWAFWEDGRFTTSPTQVKIDSLRRLLARHDGSALIALSTPVDSDPAVAQARVEQAFAGLASLRSGLDKAAALAPSANGKS